MEAQTSLATAPIGPFLTLSSTNAGPEMSRRLAALGLRRGAQLRLLHRTAGGGRVVHVAGARIALDRSMLECLLIEPLAGR